MVEDSGPVTGGPPSPEEFAKSTELVPQDIDQDALRRRLRRRSMTIDEVAAWAKSNAQKAEAALEDLRADGFLLQQFGDRYSVEKTPGPNIYDDRHRVSSDHIGEYRFGLIADNHYGSKYCREDVNEELYDWFAEEGVTRVYNCGNWIDGEARFNKHDLIPEAHGMQAQLDYFVERYPQRPGITTYYVAGDDHEGWYSQREGVDIGRMLSDTAGHAGRKDLVYLGYKEAFIRLEHAETGKHARMLVDHPGGGSAYALSYAAQKRVEAAQPGEKPAIWLFGHWHKHGYFVIRGVHVVLVPCTKDLDPFGRKKGLTYTIGGAILDIRQHPGGVIEECTPRFKLYHDRGYYNQQYSMSGRVEKEMA